MGMTGQCHQICQQGMTHDNAGDTGDSTLSLATGGDVVMGHYVGSYPSPSEQNTQSQLEMVGKLNHSLVLQSFSSGRIRVCVGI